MKIKARRIAVLSLALVVVGLVVAAGVVYLMADWTPAEYQPVTLGEQEKAEVRQEMEARFAAAFDPVALASGDVAQLSGVENVQTEEVEVVDSETGETKLMVKTTFDMPLSTKDLNNWVGSMPKESIERLAKAGVSQPAIAVDDDRVTFYAHVDKFDKVVGLDLDFKFTEDESVVVDMKSSRVGKLPIPDEVLEEYKGKLVKQSGSNLGAMSKKAGELVGGETGKLASAAVASLGPKIGAALAGKPVTLDLKQGDADVRIRGVKAVEGKLTLDVVSLAPKPSAEDLAKAREADAPAGAAGRLNSSTPDDLEPIGEIADLGR